MLGGTIPSSHAEKEGAAADAEAERSLEGREDGDDGHERKRSDMLRPANQSAVAVTVKKAPIAWANLLAGPGAYRRASSSRGVTTRVASCPSGLSVGPVSARATNP